MMVATSTSITPDKEIDKKLVLTEPTLKMEVAKNKEEQIMPISEKNRESNLVVCESINTNTSNILFRGNRIYF